MAELLKITKAHALGLVSSLWCWVIANAPDGKNLKRFTDRELAAAAGWEGDERVFRDALRKVRWLDPPSDAVHDWDLHGLRILNQSRARIARFRSNVSSNVTGNVHPGKKEREIEREIERKKEGLGGGVGGDEPPKPFEAWGQVKAQLIDATQGHRPEFSHPAIERAAKNIGFAAIRNGDNSAALRAHFVKAYEEQLAKEGR